MEERKEGVGYSTPSSNHVYKNSIDQKAKIHTKLRNTFGVPVVPLV
jgi:hypothetical protein